VTYTFDDGGRAAAGRLVVSVSGHMVAVIDGVIHDNHDCSRGGTRCVIRILAQRRLTKRP
jgi:hypothetical protein